MPTVSKIVVNWTGFIGGPGVTVIYVDSTDPDISPVHTFFNDISGIVPTGVVWDFPTTGPVMDEATGALTGAWSGDAHDPVAADGGGVHAAGTGSVIRWETGDVVGRKRLIGHTYLVPMVSAAFTTAGQLVAGTRTTMQTAADDLIAALDGHLQVWHRPSGGSGGSAHQVQSAFIPTVPANLRNRKR